MCPAFLRGTCPADESCRLAHSVTLYFFFSSGIFFFGRRKKLPAVSAAGKLLFSCNICHAIYAITRRIPVGCHTAFFSAKGDARPTAAPTPMVWRRLIGACCFSQLLTHKKPHARVPTRLPLYMAHTVKVNDFAPICDVRWRLFSHSPGIPFTLCPLSSPPNIDRPAARPF